MSGGNPLLTPIIDRAQAAPDALFALFHAADGWTPVTNADMLRRALQFTALFQTCATQGATIMLVMRHGPDAVAAFLGAMLAHAVPSFLPCPNIKQDHATYWSQHATVLKFNRPALVLVCDDLLPAMTICAAGSGAAVLPLSSVEHHAPANLPDRLPDAARIALLQHSSGTTGLKKGVALCYGAIARQLDCYTTTLHLDSTSRIVSWLPLYHDMGLISSFLLPAWRGIPILSIDPFTWVAQPDLLFEAIETYNGTHAWLPNFAFLHLARRVRLRRTWRLDGVRALISCSEPCKPAAFDAFLDRFADWGIKPEMLQTCYAMAETVFAVSQSDATRPPRRLSIDPACIAEGADIRPPTPNGATLTLLSNGKPLPGCHVTIRQDDTDLGTNIIGEICIAADYLFDGYHHNPTATQAALQNARYRTGDLGFIDQGELYIVGRLKDVIIVNGKNVFAHDVEAAVSRVAGVKPGRCAAIGRYSEKSGSETLVVIAEPDDTQTQDRALLRAINQAVMEEVGIPCSDIRLVEPGWLVKTTSGKTSRRDNALKYEALVAP